MALGYNIKLISYYLTYTNHQYKTKHFGKPRVEAAYCNSGISYIQTNVQLECIVRLEQTHSSCYLALTSFGISLVKTI